MLESKAGNTVIITSSNNELNLLLKHYFPSNDILCNSNINLRLKPKYIISVCNNTCNYKVCLKKAYLSLLNPQSIYIICRPILPNKYGKTRYGFWFSYMRLNDDKMKSFNILFPLVPIVHKNSAIIEEKRKIVETNGNIKYLSELIGSESAYKISRKIKMATGSCLKKFQKRISLCHSLHDIYLSNISIKEIAFKRHMHQNAFRKSFVDHFNISPSKIRKMREMF